MKKRKINLSWGITILVTVIMFSFIACGVDKDLNGTWLGEDDTILTYNNGKWEFSEEGITVMTGTYTTSRGEITEITTRMTIEGSSKMYSKSEVRRDKSLSEYLEDFLPRKIIYSIRGDILTQEFDDGETEVYTRK